MRHKQKIFKCGEPSPITERIYPREQVEAAIEEYFKPIGSKYGEMDGDGQAINLDRISHKIIDSYVDEEDWWWAEIETMDELPMGNILRQLLEAGLNMRIAPRGTGYVSDKMIVEGFAIIALDVAASSEQPSSRITDEDLIQTIIKMGEKQ